MIVWIFRLKYTSLLFTTLLLSLLPACRQETVAPAESGPQASATERLQTFQGAWFEVRYPADFTVKPSLPSSTAEGYDSVEFIAPDGTVTFYIFSPQWGGEAEDIALEPEREELVDEHVEKNDDRELRWFTIAAKDGSYRRSYQETVAQQGALKTIFGIGYRDEVARKHYQQQYLEFRESLEQFAD